jgi:hypothetical protein
MTMTAMTWRKKKLWRILLRYQARLFVDRDLRLGAEREVTMMMMMTMLMIRCVEFHRHCLGIVHPAIMLTKTMTLPREKTIPTTTTTTTLPVTMVRTETMMTMEKRRRPTLTELRILPRSFVGLMFMSKAPQRPFETLSVHLYQSRKVSV